jgi:hypothetical protein
MSFRISSMVVAALGVGCVSDELEPRTAEVDQQLAGCDIFMCGSNSPQIAEFGFWDLNLPPALGVPGQPNNVGLQLYGFVQGPRLYLPRVIGGRLSAILGSTTLTGSALVNGWFYLRHGSRRFQLRITEVNTVDSWAVPTSGPSVVLEDYKLDWSEFTNGNWGRFVNVCTNPPGRESGELLTMTGQDMFRTLLFEGDRIDAAHKRDTGIDTTWFNLGCAGSALAKMALTGHTEASHVSGAFHTTLAERQTMLKMLAADYCGDGEPFTVAGQPLNWRDDHGTMKLTALLMFPPQPLALESRWNENGAVCLDKPRVDAHWTALGAATFGSDVYDQVASHCPRRMPPPCADGSFATDGYHLLTATVPYQPWP